MPNHCKSIVRGVPDGPLKIPAEYAQIPLLFDVSKKRIDKYRRAGVQPKFDLTSVTPFPFQNRLKLSSEVNVRLRIRSM
jgi:hypothetical protein